MVKSTKKYSEAQESMFRFSILDILNETKQAMTIDEIKSCEPLVFDGVSTQKMARVMTNLCEMNLVRKAKSKAKNRMVYKSAAVMQEEGFNIDETEE